MNSNITDLQAIAVNSEISAFDEAIRQNNELLSRLKQSRVEVENESLAIIDAMGISFDAKSEFLEKARRFRHAAMNECKDIKSAVDSINRIVNDAEIDLLMNKMRDFSVACEKIKELHDSGFLERFDFMK